MKPKLFLTLFAAVAFAVVNAPAPAVAATAGPVRAVQVDPGVHDVYQLVEFQSERKFVAQVYVPERLADETTYVEHWVLFDGYVYPAPSSRS